MKYDTPILVSKTFGAKPAIASGAVGGGNESAKTSASSLNSGDPAANKAEDYLNSILPPREYQDSG